MLNYCISINNLMMKYTIHIHISLTGHFFCLTSFLPSVARTEGLSVLVNVRFCSCHCLYAHYFVSVTSCTPVRSGEVGTAVKMMHLPAGTENMNCCPSPIDLLLKRSGMLCQKVSTRQFSCG